MLCVKFEDLTKKAEILILQDETGLSARFSRFELAPRSPSFSPDVRWPVAAIEDWRCNSDCIEGRPAENISGVVDQLSMNGRPQKGPRLTANAIPAAGSHVQENTEMDVSGLTTPSLLPRGTRTSSVARGTLPPQYAAYVVLRGHITALSKNKKSS